MSNSSRWLILRPALYNFTHGSRINGSEFHLFIYLLIYLSWLRNKSIALPQHTMAALFTQRSLMISTAICLKVQFPSLLIHSLHVTFLKVPCLFLLSFLTTSHYSLLSKDTRETNEEWLTYSLRQLKQPPSSYSNAFQFPFSFHNQTLLGCGNPNVGSTPKLIKQQPLPRIKKTKTGFFFQSKDKLHSNSENHVSLTINTRFVSASLTLTENLFPDKSLIEIAIGAIALLNSG